MMSGDLYRKPGQQKCPRDEREQENERGAGRGKR